MKKSSNQKDGLLNYSPEEVANLLEVEELEERLEAAKWTLGIGGSSGGVSVNAKVEFG